MRTVEILIFFKMAMIESLGRSVISPKASSPEGQPILPLTGLETLAPSEGGLDEESQKS